jgi:hypothetical protein
MRRRTVGVTVIITAVAVGTFLFLPIWYSGTVTGPGIYKWRIESRESLSCVVFGSGTMFIWYTNMYNQTNTLPSSYQIGCAPMSFGGR